MASGNTLRTFSCNGTYDGSDARFPIVTIHVETNYIEALEQTHLELLEEDSKVILTGSLIIKNAQEFLKIKIKLKESGLIIFNHNSHLGQASLGPFNFVGIWLEEVGQIRVSNEILSPKNASFQCQTYRN